MQCWATSLPVSQSRRFCPVQVNLKEARNLPVWGFPWQSNPYCRLKLGSQVVRSRRDDDTSHEGSHKAPVWNQEFQFLVEDVQDQASLAVLQLSTPVLLL